MKRLELVGGDGMKKRKRASRKVNPQPNTGNARVQDGNAESIDRATSLARSDFKPIEIRANRYLSPFYAIGGERYL